MVNKTEHENFLKGRMESGNGCLAGDVIKINKKKIVLRKKGEKVGNKDGQSFYNALSFAAAARKFQQSTRAIAKKVNDIP